MQAQSQIGHSQMNSAIPNSNPPTLPGREFPNAAFLCRVGQESVQDIISKSTEMFSQLKILQLPTGSTLSATQQEERKKKCHDLLMNISMLFKRLHRIYERCNEYCSSIETTPDRPIVPLRSIDSSDELVRSQSYRPKQLSEAAQSLKIEYDEQVLILREKNIAIKKLIDSMRELIWDVNSMLAVRI